MPDLVVSEEQALAFRARRHHLLGPGADSPEQAARAVVGIQAQVVAPAAWSLAMRTASSPSAESIVRALSTSSALVRTWGQRDTVHIYDAAVHWSAVVTMLRLWPIGARGGMQPGREAIDAAHERIASLGRPVVRSDLFDLVPADFLAYMESRMGKGAIRGAAGRLVWDLSRRGLLCAHEAIGREQSYILRQDRYPDLVWTDPSVQDAGALLVRAYLSANAPATAKDIAHFLGARVTQVREILSAVDDLVPVECGQRPGLIALAQDADELRLPVPNGWPPRLLAKFDTMLMAHADKSWTVPVKTDRPKIWAKAAQVLATVLHRGRLVATWKHKATKKKVTIDITPLSGWDPGLQDALGPDVHAFAAHLGVAEAELRVA